VVARLLGDDRQPEPGSRAVVAEPDERVEDVKGSDPSM
jgi:hypothetical protein